MGLGLCDVDAHAVEHDMHILGAELAFALLIPLRKDIEEFLTIGIFSLNEMLDILELLLWNWSIIAEMHQLCILNVVLVQPFPLHHEFLLRFTVVPLLL